jgi:DNA invertase Pin-like site-specific DNA recombinase
MQDDKNTISIDEILNAQYEYDNTGVIYARYSSGRQSYQSIEGQLRVSFDFAVRERVKIVDIYIDEAISGRSDNRPAFQKMLKDSAKAKWKVIITYALDRFGRNSIEMAINKHQFKKNGKIVVSATQKTSTNVDGSKNLDGILLENVYIGFAEYYSEELSQKILRGNKESYAKGQFTGGRILYGYKVVNKRVEINENEAAYVRYIFDEYAKGKSKREIMSEVKKRGARNSRGGVLTEHSFIKNLANRKYIGEVEHDGTIYDNIFPPIIDRETFETVQKQIKKMQHTQASEKAKEEYILQGKAYCGYCGSRLIGDCGTSKQGAQHHYYSCSKRKKGRACKKRAERKRPLEQIIVRQAIDYVLEPKRLNYIADRLVKMHEAEFNDDEIKSLERRIANIDEKINAATESFIAAKNNTLRIKLNDTVTRLDNEKMELRHDLDKLRQATKIKLTKEMFFAWFKNFTDGNINDIDFCKKIIAALINCVYVYDDKLITYFNVQTDELVTKKEVDYDLSNTDAWERPENVSDKCSDTVAIGGDEGDRTPYLLNAIQSIKFCVV